ncbi:uncharacterized protein K452DRAFT_160935 [Aplosporella prunicola CBS 121167]|uniref:Uncharacterized protein n=1 Tax=Aplosporella prunicola CBS 121167 TaxID=1176127 RepID=A0A6A6BMB1_9PEZI|nr:uncharacterized protein K452DRAFT_160935 [Aplosporella prunicola CBS 121167]KAF2143681.1 hypothetical protein K452DRAFT_160935 [Aplosporella prunicola CBS 121167]
MLKSFGRLVHEPSITRAATLTALPPALISVVATPGAGGVSDGSLALLSSRKGQRTNASCTGGHNPITRPVALAAVGDGLRLAVRPREIVATTTVPTYLFIDLFIDYWFVSCRGRRLAG